MQTMTSDAIVCRLKRNACTILADGLEVPNTHTTVSKRSIETKNAMCEDGSNSFSLRIC